MQQKQHLVAAELNINDRGLVVGVKDSQPLFLQHLNKIGIFLGAQIQVIDKIDFDKSLEIKLENEKTLSISSEVSKNIFVAV
jgi:DtxR family Mn-dependent transcriptional regulator